MKTIRIYDCGTSSTYVLDAAGLTMIETGGCVDALAAAGVDLDEAMSDDEIDAAVRAAWMDGYEMDGYEGDPGLGVNVEAGARIRLEQGGRFVADGEVDRFGCPVVPWDGFTTEMADAIQDAVSDGTYRGEIGGIEWALTAAR